MKNGRIKSFDQYKMFEEDSADEMGCLETSLNLIGEQDEEAEARLEQFQNVMSSMESANLELEIKSAPGDDGSAKVKIEGMKSSVKEFLESMEMDVEAEMENWEPEDGGPADPEEDYDEAPSFEDFEDDEDEDED